METVLETVKNYLGGEMFGDSFNETLLMQINSVMYHLEQIGVKLLTYTVDDRTTWIGVISNIEQLQAIKSYVCLKVQLYFDPPNNSGLVELKNSQLAELEWRINIYADPHWSEETTT